MQLGLDQVIFGRFDVILYSQKNGYAIPSYRDARETRIIDSNLVGVGISGHGNKTIK